jgi:hypothetical protein
MANTTTRPRSYAGHLRLSTATTLALTALALASCSGSPESSEANDATSELALGPPPDAAGPIWGVTIDDVSSLSSITTSLSKLSKKPTARIVFDEFVHASYYLQPATKIHAVSYVMGELLDSEYVSLYSPADYQSRAVEYLNALAPVVDIWEVGNEINGEWVCGKNASHCTSSQTADVVSKMSGAYDQVKARGQRASLTLYYNKGCYSSSANEMFTWAQANVPARMKSGLDYVLISYYEDDCNGLQPNWSSVFTQLAAMFPNSKVGFGECGTSRASHKAAYVDHYYRMSVQAPRYVGGYFWWYFREDMVPATKSLWTVLDNAIAGR